MKKVEAKNGFKHSFYFINLGLRYMLPPVVIACIAVMVVLKVIIGRVGAGRPAQCKQAGGKMKSTCQALFTSTDP